MIMALGGAVALGAIVFAYFLGMGHAAKVEIRKALREAGITKESAKLLGRAAKILNRMVRVTELDGDFAADILSEPTKKLVNEWVDDYKKEINKV